MKTHYHYSSAFLHLFSILFSDMRILSQFTAALFLQRDQILIFLSTTEFLAQ